jgi:hypothetical protein
MKRLLSFVIVMGLLVGMLPEISSANTAATDKPGGNAENFEYSGIHSSAYIDETDEYSDFIIDTEEVEIEKVDPLAIETVVDIVSIGWSFVDLIKNPSWGNAGFLAWDIGAAFLPFVPGSYTAKGLKTVARTFQKANLSKIKVLHKADMKIVTSHVSDLKITHKADLEKLTTRAEKTALKKHKESNSLR